MPYVIDLTPSHYDNGEYRNIESKLVDSERCDSDAASWKLMFEKIVRDN